MKPRMTLRRVTLCRPLLAASIAVALAGCPSKTASPKPQGGGDPAASSGGAPSGGAAAPVLAAARQAREEGRLADAWALYQALLKDHPKAGEVPVALLESAKVAATLGNKDGARKALEELAVMYPTHAAARDAKLLLASMDLEDGRTQEGVSGMRSALEQLPPKERAELSAKMGRALHEGGQHAGAVLPLATAEAAAPEGADKADLRALILQIVDGQLRFPEVLALREQLPTGPGYTRTLLTLKLARIYTHLGDDPRATEEFKAYLAAEPQGAFAPAAQQALTAIETRNTVSPNRLGVVLPASGKYAQTGERILTALKLGLESAVGEAIAKGQTNPPPSPVEVVVQDDTGGAEDAAKAVDVLVQEHRAMAVVGAITTQGSRPAAMRAESARIPLLTLARREGLGEMGPFTYQLGLTDEHQAREVARIAVEMLGYKRIAVLYPRLPKGVALLNAFWDEFEARGGAVAGVESYDHDETTFSAPVKKLVGRHYLEARGDYLACLGKSREMEQAYKRQKAAEGCKDEAAPVVDFDAIFIADYHKPAGLIAPALAFEDVFVGSDERALRQFKQATGATRVRQVQLLGTNGFNDKTFPVRGGKYVQGAVFVDGFNPNDGRPETLAFVKAFTQASGGVKPELREAQAYDAGRMLGAVFAQNPKSRAEFREKLSALKDFPGVCGPTTFDAQGTAVTPLHVFTIKGEAIIPAHLEPKSGG